MKILIYSFEPFQDLKSNPAYDIAKTITERYNSKAVELIQLPVTYNCWELLKTKIIDFKPTFILGLGVAIGINKIKVEKIGLNYKHADIPDNAGKKVNIKKINESKNLAYESKIDVLTFVNDLKNKEIPAEISFNTGTYVCNYVYYNCLEYTSDKNIKALFIHVPVSPKESIKSHLNVSSFPTDLIANELFNILNKMQP